MHSLEPEILELQRAGALTEDTAQLPLALESGRLFSVHGELFVALYGAVAAVVAGVGLLVKANLDRIGPLTLVIAIALAAAACYAWTLRGQRRGSGETRGLAGDYVLLLGALLVSADVGYAEYQFHLFGAAWSRHLLLLAVFHGATAYLLDSRLVLSVALTAFAGWLGVEVQFGNVLDPVRHFTGLGWRSLACALLCLGAREVHRRSGSRRPFADVYESFALNLAFLGTLALISDPATRPVGALLLAGITALVVVVGMKRRAEGLVLPAIAYATLGACILEAVYVREPMAVAMLMLMTVLTATFLLWRSRSLLREPAP